MIARVARLTNQSATDVLHLPGPLFRAVADEAAVAADPPLLEAQRVTCDLLWLVIRALTGIKDEWRYPRPGDAAPASNAVSPLEAARLMMRRDS